MKAIITVVGPDRVGIIAEVCTLLAEESTEHRVPDGFTPITDRPAGAWRPFGIGWRVLPQDAGTDGMILFRWRRTG